MFDLNAAMRGSVLSLSKVRLITCSALEASHNEWYVYLLLNQDRHSQSDVSCCVFAGATSEKSLLWRKFPRLTGGAPG